MNVLLVDDDIAFRTLFREVLLSKGHTVTECACATEAETAWKTNPTFHLVSLDYKMPDTNGVELCKWFRRQKNTKDTYILIVTGHDSPELLKEVIDADANDYISKTHFGKVINIRLSILEKQIKQIQDKKTAEREKNQSEERFKIVSEKSRDLICTHNPQKIITYASLSCENILGFEPKELEGTSIETLRHPSDEEFLNWDSETNLQDGNIQLITQHRLKKKDGSYAWVETFVQPDETPDGTYYYSYSREITQAKEEELLIESLLAPDPKPDTSSQIKSYVRRICSIYDCIGGIYITPPHVGRNPYVITDHTTHKDLLLNLGEATPEDKPTKALQEAASLLPDCPLLAEKKIQSAICIPIPSITIPEKYSGKLIILKETTATISDRGIKLLNVAAGQIACILEKLNKA
jgi:PAS domain S-box-containing protein